MDKPCCDICGKTELCEVCTPRSQKIVNQSIDDCLCECYG